MFKLNFFYLSYDKASRFKPLFADCPFLMIHNLSLDHSVSFRYRRTLAGPTIEMFRNTHRDCLEASPSPIQLPEWAYRHMPFNTNFYNPFLDHNSCDLWMACI